MDIVVADQNTFCVSPSVSLEEAKGRVAAFKGSAFGGITQMFSRPKPEDVTLEPRGLRYEPVWHARAQLRIVYDRKEPYRFPIKGPDFATKLTIAGTDFAIEGDRKDRYISMTATAHCVREFWKELWVDGTTGETTEARAFPAMLTEAIEIETFVPAEGALVEPSIRASAVVRQLLGNDVAPTEADEVHEERCDIDRFELFFRPVYEFHLNWAAKSKTADVLVDAIDGTITQIKSPLHPILGKLLHKETLFDIGSETLNLVVPGGAIPLKIVRALSARRQNEHP